MLQVPWTRRAGIVTILTCILFVLALGLGHRSKPYWHTAAVQSPGNATFGVEKIVAMNLRDRIDKRMGLSLAAGLSGVQITYMDAPSAADLNERGLPPFHESLRGGSLASFLAHANVWRKQVEEGWTTVLALEDDSDWDVHMKDELKKLAAPLTRLTSKVAGSEKLTVDPADPYNHKDWDLIYMGHCIEIPPEDDVHLTYQDPHTPSWEVCDQSVRDIYTHYNLQLPMTPEHPESNTAQTRLIQKSKKPVCTTAYITSLQGATKLLELTHTYWYTALDLQIMDYINDGRITSYSIEPPLITQWKDNDSFNSDIGLANDDGTPVRVKKNPEAVGKPWYNIKTSVRTAAKALLFSKPSR